MATITNKSHAWWHGLPDIDQLTPEQRAALTRRIQDAAALAREMQQRHPLLKPGSGAAARAALAPGVKPGVMVTKPAAGVAGFWGAKRQPAATVRAPAPQPQRTGPCGYWAAHRHDRK